MIALGRGQVVDPSAPALTFIGQSQGQIVAALSLSYRILDMSTPDKQATGGVQVFPVSGLQPVNLEADAVTTDPNNEHGGGVYVARWSVPADEPVGRHEIEWTFELTQPVSSTFTTIVTEPAPAGVARKAFEVLASAAPPAGMGPRYAFLHEAREDLGCTPNDVSDVRLLRLLTLASLFVERVTGRWFEPRFSFLRYSGRGIRQLQISPAIIGVSSVGVDTEPTQAGDLVVDLDMLRIFNRHLSQGMGVGSDDDRNNPKIEFVHSDDLYGVRFVPFRGISLRSLAFPNGVQNVHVRGVFGYTDPDGSPWGETPLLIQHVTKLIVARELPKIGNRDDREDAQWRWRVTQDKAKDISVNLVEPRKWGSQAFGDPEIDSILTSFARPPSMGAA